MTIDPLKSEARKLPNLLATLVAVFLLTAGCTTADTADSSDSPDEASAPEHEPAAVEAEAPMDQGAVSSPQELVPLGQVGSVRWNAPVGAGVNWDVTVSGVDFDAAPQGHEEPVAGRQNVLIELTLTNRSSAPARTMGQVNSGAEAGGNTYLQNIDNCGYSVVDQTLGNPAQVQPGETVTRTICWLVEPSDIESLRVSFVPMAYQDERVWFALR